MSFLPQAIKLQTFSYPENMGVCQDYTNLTPMLLRLLYRIATVLGLKHDSGV